MSLVLGIDPGTYTHGITVYDTGAERVLWSNPAACLDDVRKAVRLWDDIVPSERAIVVIERVESYGIAGGDLIVTAENGGRIAEAALSITGNEAQWMTRREVCQQFGISGKGKDAQVRQACLLRHGRTAADAVGSKKAPGPLYGVTSHAWQALGLVLAWHEREAMRLRAAGGV